MRNPRSRTESGRVGFGRLVGGIDRRLDRHLRGVIGRRFRDVCEPAVVLARGEFAFTLGDQFERDLVVVRVGDRAAYSLPLARPRPQLFDKLRPTLAK